MRGRTSTLKVAILCFERDREKLEPLKEILGRNYEVEFVDYRKDVWNDLMEYDCIVAYLASGIVVRGICGKLKGKWDDPAVIVLDKPLKHAVVLLGGHHGGNEIVKQLEEVGIKAVITTAMEFTEGYSVGVGFRKNATADEILEAIEWAIREVKGKMEDIRVISTVEAKRGSAIVEVAGRLKRPLVFVRAEEINSMDIRETEAVKIGVKNVAEACAIYASNSGKLILPKRVYRGVTVAIAW